MSGTGPRILRLVEGEGAPADMPEAGDAFPGEWRAPWLRAQRKLEGAGYGAGVTAAYRRLSPACARAVGPEPAIDLADTVSAIAIKAGRSAAERLSEAAVAAARRLGDGPRFRNWLSLMQRFAAMAPESVPTVLGRTDEVLSQVNVSGLESWLLGGVRLAGAEADRRRAFFEQDSPDGARLLERETGRVSFFDMERRMKAYLGALYGVRMPIREAPPGRHDGAGRRASFSEGLIRMPATFPGFNGPEAEALFRASLAHIGAHIRFTPGRFPVGELKPMQIAVVSLIEDARVEALAMREMPGLRRLWMPFHIAQASGALTTPSLFARLSRALIDPEFEDIDGWVRKGRDMFLAAEPDWENASISRAIGNLLGNDLGQMRVQFNPKTHVVQPPYRDDNLGLWDFGEEPDQQSAEDEIVVESVCFERREDRPEEADRERREQSEAGLTSVRLRPADDPDRGVPVARYPEYDHEAGRERPDWTTLVEYPPRAGAARFLDEVLDRRADEVARITELIRAARVGRAQRLRRQAEGETLDLDAAIDAAAALRMGDVPDPRVYQTMARRHRDLAVSVLLDISQSTADRVPGAGRSVLDMEREATVLLAHAMQSLGDPFSVAAFSSNGREDVRVTRIKDFAQPFGREAAARLAGLAPGYSTRIGAALRHVGAELAHQPSHRRLVLVVTDGEPSDIDCADPDYLIEDARRAVHALGAQGIDVFAVCLGHRNTDTETRIFGRRGYIQIARVAALTERLPALYMRLTL